MKDIRNEAIKKGICKEWAHKMQTASLKEYCQMFFDGSDWAMENDFPSLPLLRKYLDTSKYGLYTDTTIEIANPEQVAFFGNSKASLVYDNYAVGELYVRHDSSVSVIAKDHAILYITIDDRAKVDVKVLEDAVVNIYRYNGTATGNAIIHERQWK